MTPALRQILFRPPAAATPAYTAEAVALFAAMSVQPDATRKGLINACIVSLKASGVWAKEDWLVVFAAHDEQAGLLNWKDPSQSFSKVGLVTFTTDRGFNLTVAANTNYLLMPELLDAAGNVYALNDAHYSTYLNAFAFKTGGAVVSSGTTNYNTGLGQPGATAAFSATINTTTWFSTGTDATASHFLGMWAATRTGSTASGLYKGGSAVNGLNSWTDSVASTAAPAAAPRLLWGDNVVAWGPPDATTRMAFYSSGSSFDATAAANEENAIKTFLTAIGAS